MINEQYKSGKNSRRSRREYDDFPMIDDSASHENDNYDEQENVLGGEHTEDYKEMVRKSKNTNKNKAKRRTEKKKKGNRHPDDEDYPKYEAAKKGRRKREHFEGDVEENNDENIEDIEHEMSMKNKGKRKKRKQRRRKSQKRIHDDDYNYDHGDDEKEDHANYAIGRKGKRKITDKEEEEEEEGREYEPRRKKLRKSKKQDHDEDMDHPGHDKIDNAKLNEKKHELEEVNEVIGELSEKKHLLNNAEHHMLKLLKTIHSLEMKT
ncbi:hypothetical protein, conserved [Plasmodium ovale curtisi]|nr:hypothetical protein, conserved [Plasmodium ovale curtisi]